MSVETIRAVGRIVAGGFYDHQDVRQAEMNRIRDVIRKKNEGIDLSQPEPKKDKKKFSKEYADEKLVPLLARMLKEGKITPEEHKYISDTLRVLVEARKQEEKYKRLMLRYAQTEPIYTEYLSKIKGIGPVLGSQLIYYVGYGERYEHVSSLWKHWGLHVVNGKAPKRQKGTKVDWNPKLRTLAWKIADQFIKQRTPLYRDIYDKEKERQLRLMENKAENAPESRGHAENRARRKMVKIFLQHYWVTARKMAGLPVTEPYAIAKLKHPHYIEPSEAVEESG